MAAMLDVHLSYYSFSNDTCEAEGSVNFHRYRSCFVLTLFAPESFHYSVSPAL